MFKKSLMLLCVLSASACTITQNIEPAELTKGSEICIIENTAVKADFLKEFTSALSSKSIAHRVVTPDSVPESCEWTATYLAKWSWDLRSYMAYAEIKVFHNGSLDGKAVYDSTGGSANSKKFIDTEPKIRELVNQLMQHKSAALFFRKYG
jgi:hypothetical protein